MGFNSAFKELKASANTSRKTKSYKQSLRWQNCMYVWANPIGRRLIAETAGSNPAEGMSLRLSLSFVVCCVGSDFCDQQITRSERSPAEYSQLLRIGHMGHRQKNIYIYIYIYIYRVSQELRSLIRDLIPELILSQKCHKHTWGPIRNGSGVMGF